MAPVNERSERQSGQSKGVSTPSVETRPKREQKEHGKPFSLPTVLLYVHLLCIVAGNDNIKKDKRTILMATLVHLQSKIEMKMIQWKWTNGQMRTQSISSIVIIIY